MVAHGYACCNSQCSIRTRLMLSFGHIRVYVFFAESLLLCLLGMAPYPTLLGSCVVGNDEKGRQTHSMDSSPQSSSDRLPVLLGRTAKASKHQDFVQCTARIPESLGECMLFVFAVAACVDSCEAPREAPAPSDPEQFLAGDVSAETAAASARSAFFARRQRTTCRFGGFQV